MKTKLIDILASIKETRRTVPQERSALVAISGIDGCGKGYITGQLVAALQAEGLRPAGINVDGWLNLPSKRFCEVNPAEHFYLHALRLDEMFAQLIIPLRDNRSVRMEMDYAEETATQFRKHICDFQNIDVILLEGIYLLKQEFQRHYDLSIWIECSFETALKRAIARGQEGLAAEETTKAYDTIYFPAQKIHFERDQPKEAADLILVNDPSLA